ncbi:MAG: hypothetical protein ACYCXT_08115 [Acidiferrobacteraceae bacterium]
MGTATYDVDTVDVVSIIQDLMARGVRLTSTPLGTIQVSPASGLSAADRALILSHKPELLAELRKCEHGVHGEHCFGVIAPRALYANPTRDVHGDGETPLTTRVSLADFRAIPVLPAPPLSPADEATIRAWLQSSGETPASIASDLEVFRRRLDTRQWLLKIIEREAGPARKTRNRSPHGRPAEDRVTQLAAEFYDHLFGPGIATRCCGPSHDRYCDVGRELRDTYYTAAKAVGKLT